MSNEEFQSALETLLNTFPEQIKNSIVIEELDAGNSAQFEGAEAKNIRSSVCTRWGRNPETGQLVCLKWE